MSAPLQRRADADIPNLTPRGDKVIHQIDHLFVPKALKGRLKSYDIGPRDRVRALVNGR